MVAVGVLALQGDVREHLRALTECGRDARTGGRKLSVTARVVRRPEELDTVDALVIPGGESTTISKLAVELGLLDPVRKRVAEGMPAYGSCAGMIMLAGEVLDGRPDQQSFGGIEMTVRRNAFGRQVDSFEAPVELAGVPGPAFRAVFIRAPWVERVGPGVQVLGRVDRPDQTAELADGAFAGAGRIVAVRQRNLLATAFHPELTPDLRVHRYFLAMAAEAAT